MPGRKTQDKKKKATGKSFAIKDRKSLKKSVLKSNRQDVRKVRHPRPVKQEVKETEEERKIRLKKLLLSKRKEIL